MKFNTKILEEEKSYLAHLEKMRQQLRQEASNCFQTAKDIVDSLNIEWAEYLGKRVKLTCNNRWDKTINTYECYFEGFKVESEGMYPSTPKIRPALFEIKKDGSESKRVFHLHHYLNEIIEIELLP